MRTVTLVLATCLIAGCGGRHPATPEEQALSGSVVTSIQMVGPSHTEATVALPYGTALLVAPLLGTGCVIGQESENGSERLNFRCNNVATSVAGEFVRTADHFTVDLHGDGVFAFSYTADLTARPDFLDGKIALSIERNLILSTIGLSTEIEFHGLTRDASGCVTTGSLVASLKAEVPGQDLDYAIDALYGPGCGTILVAD